MRRFLFVSFVMIASCALGMAQTVVFSDNFDSYTAGSHLAQSNPAWTTYNNAPGSSEDGVISNAQAASAPNSLYISGAADQIYSFPHYTSGHYTISFNMYIPSSGEGGYFNIQHNIGQLWALGCYYYNNGTGFLTAGDSTFNFNYPANTWFPVVIDIDINQDQASLNINNTEVNSWPFHYSEENTNGSITLDAIDFYAWSATNVSGSYYVDDFNVTEVSAALVGHFAVSPDTLQVTMAPNDSCTLDLTCSNPGTNYIQYRIVPSYDIPNPNMTSTGETVLRYCGDSILTAWGYLGGAQYDIAIGFPSDSIQAHIGKTLQSISVFTTDQITNAKVRVYDMSFNGPGEVLYEQPFVPVNGWNNVSLLEPIILDGRDLWVGVWIDQPDSVWPVFCDTHSDNNYSDWFTAANYSNWYSHSTMYPYHHMIMAYIDGTPINPWLNVSPSSSVILSSNFYEEDSVNVAVTVNTYGMTNGENHSAKLHCFSTDYDNLEVVVPVYLSITGVSVNEHNEIEVAIYPNPATNFVNITSDQILRVEIYNLMGQKLFDNTYNDSRVVIPTTSFSAGTYVVNVTTTGGKTTKKVVVQ